MRGNRLRFKLCPFPGTSANVLRRRDASALRRRSFQVHLTFSTIWLHTAPLVVAGEYGGLRDAQAVVVLVVSVLLGGLTFCLGVRGFPDVRWGLRRPERWSSPRRLTAFSVSAGAGR